MEPTEILRRCNEITKNTLMETLGITYTAVTADSLTASMPVTTAVYQPDGVLHGGATAALAESAGSAACYVFLDTQDHMVRGLEISANHVRSVSSGHVHATASMLHHGRTTQIWEIRIVDDADQLISICKLSTIRLPKKQ